MDKVTKLPPRARDKVDDLLDMIESRVAHRTEASVREHMHTGIKHAIEGKHLSPEELVMAEQWFEMGYRCGHSQRVKELGHG